MPSWKKVIVSGSDANLSSLYTSGAITGSEIRSTGVISGSEVSASTYYGDGSQLSGLATATDVSGSWQGVIGSGSLGMVSGSAISTGSFGYLHIGGNITASGTVKADAFESVTGGTTIDFGDSLGGIEIDDDSDDRIEDLFSEECCKMLWELEFVG